MVGEGENMRGGHDPPQEVSPAAQGRQAPHHWAVLGKATDEVCTKTYYYVQFMKTNDKRLQNAVNMERSTTVT